MIFKAKTKNEIILIPKKPIKGLRYLKFICELPNLYGKILEYIFYTNPCKIKIKKFYNIKLFSENFLIIKKIIKKKIDSYNEYIVCIKIPLEKILRNIH
ncbi:hypothetical protein CM15mP43_04230 [bacterium]|nr:MAG: hypothetical protein CM15mP43_04230 [bacterium]